MTSSIVKYPFFDSVDILTLASEFSDQLSQDAGRINDRVLSNECVQSDCQVLSIRNINWKDNPELNEDLIQAVASEHGDMDKVPERLHNIYKNLFFTVGGCKQQYSKLVSKGLVEGQTNKKNIKPVNHWSSVIDQYLREIVQKAIQKLKPYDPLDAVNYKAIAKKLNKKFTEFHYQKKACMKRYELLEYRSIKSQTKPKKKRLSSKNPNKTKGKNGVLQLQDGVTVGTFSEKKHTISPISKLQVSVQPLSTNAFDVILKNEKPSSIYSLPESLTALFQEFQSVKAQVPTFDGVVMKRLYTCEDKK